jgi:hypothetical protein
MGSLKERYEILNRIQTLLLQVLGTFFPFMITSVACVVDPSLNL